ncbi:TonB-dependent receptor plug domain-containing protein [Actinobacillus vicugnae]|uniref:TonB-dependent receptor plug domain-containing protein n=1 Tax=Actinobacillus vicugnae TaxID=2573093 RepID=UPI001240C84B|nr:TonB-dependent receptor plug domain-containing protein [Actinobacillus vicugnae]
MQKTKIALLVSSTFFASNIYAENTIRLDEVIVKDRAFSQKIGTQKITAEQIKRLPSTNGNITELLKNNPNVLYSNMAELSTSAGEISPDEVSFHGEKYYNNNFTIDGISNNDNINPATNNAGRGGKNPTGFEAYDLPSAGSQSFWLNTKLVKNMEAFDSNVSAKYGNFTGGVINVELKDPDFDENHGSISYRTTRGSWAKFHVQEDKQDDFANSKRLDYQPDFTKNQYSVNVSQPLSDSTSLLFSYNRTDSDIKSIHSYMYSKADPSGYTTAKQKRVSETYLLKGVHFTENGDQWKATLMYSPHKAKYFRQNVMNGGYSNTGGGYSAQLDWEKQFEHFKMTTKFSYKKTGNEIENDEGVYRRYVSSDSIGWVSNSSGQALYGGYGKYETEKDTFTLKQDFKLNEFDWKDSSHKVILGWQADLSRAKYIRTSEAWQYYYTNNSNIVCGDMNECIEGEQYATSAQAYPIRNVKVNDSNYAIYAEDNIQYKNLDLNLGIRADYNQFLKNINIAPRTSLSYDVFGDEQTRLFGGFNRYYATSMLAYKLRQGIGNRDRWIRNADTNYEWVYSSSGSTPVQTATSDLDTPYSDEYVLGIGQKILGTDVTLKWVHRDGKKTIYS